MRYISSLIVASALGSLACAAQGAVLKFDLGDSGASWISSGNVNNLTYENGGTSLTNTVDVDGNLTGIQVLCNDSFWPGSNQNGTSTPSGAAAAIFGANATKDNLFGSVVPFGNPAYTEPTGGYSIRGLDPSGNTKYTFTFFGSRNGVSDNRETAYSVTGANASIVYLNTSNNVSNVVVAADIVPNAQGRIQLTVGPGPNNNNASKFYYIGAMQIVSVVPEPASLSILGVSAALLRRRR